MQRNINWFRARQNCIGSVIFVEWRKDDDFVTGIARGHHGDHHRLGAAAGDDKMPVGINGEAGEPGDFPRERLAKTRRAPGDGVLMKRSARGAFERDEQFLRRIEIGKPLREIDRAVSGSQAASFPESRIPKTLQVGSLVLA